MENNVRMTTESSPLFKLQGRWVLINLSTDNLRTKELDLDRTESMQALVDGEMKRNSGELGYGGYLERRGWYVRNANFMTPGSERVIHLGIDFWVPTYTAVYAPLPGIVDSFQDNAAVGDYGPTVIIRHQIKRGEEIFALYGHLSRDSLKALHVGMQVPAGAVVGQIGSEKENGNWPPHLHFQLIRDLGGKSGDYPGVTSEADLPFMKKNCPDPLAASYVTYRE
jgi:murein DD-endopeptidase MepM/ murein hydrolase activator NlpD